MQTERSALFTLAARFWAKVDQDGPGGCWLWTAALYRNGYGIFNVRGRSCLAHRVAYELAIGPIPEGLQIDHVRARGCMHRHCVNPAHLEAVTQRENLLRGDTVTAANAAKTHCPQGHAYDEANTMAQTDGGRKCRQCQRDRAELQRRAAGKALGNSRKTHCPQGHPYDEANTHVAIYGGGAHRECRTCGREKARARRKKNEM